MCVVLILLCSLLEILYYCWLFWFWLSVIISFNSWLFVELCLSDQFKPSENLLYVFILASVRNITFKILHSAINVKIIKNKLHKSVLIKIFVLSLL